MNRYVEHPILGWIWYLQGLGLCLLVLLSFFPSAFHIQEIVFFSLCGLALVGGWLEGNGPNLRTSIDWPLGLLIGWILLTIPFSLDPAYSFGEWRKLVAQCLVFYWVVFILRKLSLRNYPQSLGLIGKSGNHLSYYHAIFLCVLLGTLCLSVVSLGEFLALGGNWQDRSIRAGALFSDYNWLATYLVLSIPVIVYFWVIARRQWEKWISVISLGLAGIAHLASYSRAGWLASAVQIVLIGILSRHWKILGGGIFSLLLIGGVLLVMGKMGYQSDTLNAWTLETRVQVANLGLNKMMEHPFVGIGYGNHIFQPVLADTPMGEKPMHLHNTFLMVGVGSGFPALSFYCWMWFAIGKRQFGGWKKKELTDTDKLNFCLGIVLVGFLTRNFFDYMFAGSLAYLFWILMACGEFHSSEKGT